MKGITYSEEILSNGVRHIVFVGVLDSNVAMNRGDELHDFVTREGGTVLVDLSELEYLSSSGMRVILRCSKTLFEMDGALHLAAPQPRVMSVITIAGFVPTCPVYQTLDEALEALSG
jgi:anti-anti-sigma factor